MALPPSARARAPEPAEPGELDGAPIAVLEIDAGGTVLRMNAAARALVGEAGSFAALAADPAQATTLLARAFAGEAPRSTALRLAGRPVIVSFEPRRDGGGAVERVRCFATDLTGYGAEAGAAEARARESAERMRWLIENASEAIWRFELDQPCPVSLPEDEQIERFYRDGFLAECNEAMARMYGFGSALEMIGLRLGQILVRADPKNEAFLRAFIRSGYRLVDAESVDVGKDGALRHVSNSLIGDVRDGLGRHAWGSTRDITERKRAEASLRESEERLRLAVEAADLGTWDLDPASGAATCSPRLLALLGVPAGTPMSRERFLASVHTDDRARIRSAMERAFDLGTGGVYHVEYRVEVGPEEAERWLSARGMALFDAAGAPIRLVGITLDISARRLIRDALHARTIELGRANDELARSNTELEQFAYIASHDLQEPLRMVTNYLNLVLKRHAPQLEGKAADFIHEAYDGAKRMQALIRGLLDYSRLGAAHAPGRVDANLALDEAMANLSAKIISSGAAIERARLPEVVADRMLLAQVFQNLLSNALKFRQHDAPAIAISAQEREHDCVFSVRDNGIGIDPLHHSTIFQIFRRLHTRDEYPGTGIGLAAVKKIIERHGGRIWIESSLGSGTTFLFTLPRPRAQTTTSARAPAAHP